MADQFTNSLLDALQTLGAWILGVIRFLSGWQPAPETIGRFQLLAATATITATVIGVAFRGYAWLRAKRKEPLLLRNSFIRVVRPWQAVNSSFGRSFDHLHAVTMDHSSVAGEERGIVIGADGEEVTDPQEAAKIIADSRNEAKARLAAYHRREAGNHLLELAESIEALKESIDQMLREIALFRPVKAHILEASQQAKREADAVQMNANHIVMNYFRELRSGPISGYHTFVGADLEVLERSVLSLSKSCACDHKLIEPYVRFSQFYRAKYPPNEQRRVVEEFAKWRKH